MNEQVGISVSTEHRPGFMRRFISWLSESFAPLKHKSTGYYVEAWSLHGFGWIRADELIKDSSGKRFWKIKHPTANLEFITIADSGFEAIAKANEHFNDLAFRFGGKFLPQC